MTLTTWFAIGIAVIGLGTLHDAIRLRSCDYYKNLLKGSMWRKFEVLVGYVIACFIWPVRIATTIVKIFKEFAKR